MYSFNGKKRQDYRLSVGLGAHGVTVSVYTDEKRDGTKLPSLATRPDDASDRVGRADGVKCSHSSGIAR